MALNGGSRKQRVILRRYTNLAVTIHVLRHQKITLLSPIFWDDRNDAYFMSQYKNRKRATSVLALCFAQAAETYHHWRVFSPGTDGICIQFDKEELLKSLPDNGELTSGLVDYKTTKEIRKKGIDLNNLPFIKRAPFSDEKEFRLIYVSTQETIDTKDYEITPSSIFRITLSPWMPKPLVDSVKATLKSIPNCEKLSVSQSTLVDNDFWKRVANPNLDNRSDHKTATG
jgi:hypothetical protein